LNSGENIKSKVKKESEDPRDITIPLDDDLDRYLRFPEKTRLFRYRGDAALAGSSPLWLIIMASINVFGFELLPYLKEYF